MRIVLSAGIVFALSSILASCITYGLPAGDLTSLPPTPSMASAASVTRTRPLCPTVTPSPRVFLTTPPLPPPPTVPLPARVPPFDFRQLELSTRTLAPGEKISIPPTREPVNYPTEPPTNPVTPVANWIGYHDLDIGFSFKYPANWQINAPDQSCQPVTPTGTFIVVRNYNYSIQVMKGLVTPEMLSIKISVAPDFAQYGALDNWVAQYRRDGTPNPDSTYSPVTRFMVGTLTAVRWTVKAPMAPEGVVEVGFGKAQWLYLIQAYPATSKLLATFDRIVSSFQIP